MSDDYGDKAGAIIVVFVVFVALGLGAAAAAPLAVAAFANDLTVTIEVALPAIAEIVGGLIAVIGLVVAALKQ